MDRTDFDITIGQLQNQRYSKEFIATPQAIVFLHNLWCCKAYSKFFGNNVDFETGP